MMTEPLTLVTGGAGYFGSVLTRRLLEDGARVRVLDISPDHDLPPEVEYFQADILDREAVRKACRGVAVVHHNVAQVPLAKSRRLFREVNCTGASILLEESAAAGVRKLVVMSTSAVFGAPRTNPVTESTPPRPREPYGESKLQAERLCHDFSRRRGLDITLIRPRTILGHGRLGIFQILFEWVRRGSNIPVFDGGRNIYQFVHASDLAEACVLAARRPGAAVYNIGTDRFGSMRETLEALCRHASTGSRLVSVPSAPAKLLMRFSSALGLSPLAAYHTLMYGESLYFDISKAVLELGWRPRFSNEQMICESYDFYQRNRPRLSSSHIASRHRSALKPGILRFVELVLNRMPLLARDGEGRAGSVSGL